MAEHQHHFQPIADPDEIEALAEQLNWPDDAAEHIRHVERCVECRALGGFAWRDANYREHYAPAWMMQRLRHRPPPDSGAEIEAIE